MGAESDFPALLQSAILQDFIRELTLLYHSKPAVCNYVLEDGSIEFSGRKYQILRQNSDE